MELAAALGGAPSITRLSLDCSFASGDDGDEGGGPAAAAAAAAAFAGALRSNTTLRFLTLSVRGGGSSCFGGAEGTRIVLDGIGCPLLPDAPAAAGAPAGQQLVPPLHAEPGCRGAATAIPAPAQVFSSSSSCCTLKELSLTHVTEAATVASALAACLCRKSAIRKLSLAGGSTKALAQIVVAVSQVLADGTAKAPLRELDFEPLGRGGPQGSGACARPPLLPPLCFTLPASQRVFWHTQQPREKTGTGLPAAADL